MNPEIQRFNDSQVDAETDICNQLASIIDKQMSESESKLRHGHPVWFLDENPIVGYSKLKAGIRLMFWSGASFNEEKLQIGTGKFKDASIFYSIIEHINQNEIRRRIKKGKEIQWNYKTNTREKVNWLD